MVDGRVFKTRPYIYLGVYYGASGDMLGGGEGGGGRGGGRGGGEGGGGGGGQSLAGERLWHGSMRVKFLAIAQPRQPDPVLAFKIVSRWAHVGTICMPAEKSTYACVQLSQVMGHWGGAYPSGRQYSDCKPIFRIKL